MKTTRKLIFLNQFIKEEFSKIAPEDSGNIVGVKIAKKSVAGNDGRNYSIVFQVNEKKALHKLKENQVIPKFIDVTFEDGTTRKIATDVEETGSFSFHSFIGNKVTSKLSNTNSYGSTGIFVTDDGVRTLMVTNYHVVAENLMKNGQTYYRRPPGNNTLNVKIRTNDGNEIAGVFEEGRIAADIDVAFVHIPGMQPHMSLNTLPNDRRIQGRVNLSNNPLLFNGKRVMVFSFHNRNGVVTTVTNTSSVINDGEHYFKDLLQMKRVTNRGDSGGIVLTQNYMAMGLIIGSDNNYSYAIPFYKIDYFKNFQII